jgi:deoxycytidylate deaminase
MQDRGDDMRRMTGDNAVVARTTIRKIREERARLSDRPKGEIDGRPRAYVIDSLRHPAEVHLLRRVYQEAFALVGVVCDPENRERRLLKDLFDFKDRMKLEIKKKAADFIDRDADAPEKHGQHVTDTFHEADFFVDNSQDAGDDISNTAMNEPIRRFVGILTGGRVVRPTMAETAMHHAHSAQMRSSCMSRQVGAALVDEYGNIVATGTNEVPKAGGGVYGEDFEATEALDDRCVFREAKFCSSNREQNAIIEELIDTFPALLDGRNRDEVVVQIRKTRLGGLIEFSRAVHAEMDAVLSAARTGVPLRGTRLFVSTFPCHYCARHIVSAGIDEVQYIEPYPKSRALHLHSDSITTDTREWRPPSQRLREMREEEGARKQLVSKVLFRPFAGVAPRMYRKAFLKDRDLKHRVTGEFAIGLPDWGSPSDLSAVRYTELEAELGAVSE